MISREVLEDGEGKWDAELGNRHCLSNESPTPTGEDAGWLHARARVLPDTYSMVTVWSRF
jgi:hypothetical protein